jgi:hypothetical protein
MVAGLGDDGPAPGMADQENRALLHVDHAMGGRYVVAQRAEGILDGDCFQPTLGEQGDDLRPAGAVGERAMHENDRLDCHDASPRIDR